MSGTIAVVGASNDRRKYGNKCVRAYVDAGWRVFPVNPGERTIEGLPAYARLDEVPKPLDRVSVYLPPAVTLRLLPEIAAAEAPDTIFNPGAADRSVLEHAKHMGLPHRSACAIVEIGSSPAAYP